MLNGMSDSLTSVNFGNAQRATRNKRRKSLCRPTALFGHGSCLSVNSANLLAHPSAMSRHRATLPDNRTDLGGGSARLSDGSSCLCRHSADLWNDRTGLLDDSTGVWNHSPRLPNRCKPLKTSFLAEIGHQSPFLPVGTPRCGVQNGQPSGLSLPFAWFASFAVHFVSET